ncbi:cysteine desulfurase /L-selenocysteine selenide-lyase (L-alanine-forming) [Panacagrimonas perspica]|uniref:cysteine desulfurase n=1 Tax=Panacagrimonas perspica TaxID=381431 RepID=A0A4R7PCP0_9GAMM|nr:family 2A encapsulin nanocompartment cargo protein cysteine desulfurase [Panacagrimonas perspica]TDU31863.1 cysteine desulfurase /L-selenocysteine selenide-lyase (L-alanine-forming) [Panacagrimonas perspica]
MPKPAGLPDLASLTALANEMFQQLPGGGPLGSTLPGAPTRPVSFGPPPVPGLPTLGSANLIPHPTSLPVTPPLPVTQSAVAQHLAPPSVITPRVVPTMAQTPDAGAASATAVPALGRASGPAQAVPEGYAANAPAAAPIPGLADATVPSTFDAAPSSLAGGSSPFYFLDTTSGAPQTRGASTTGERSAPGRESTSQSSRESRPALEPSLPSFAGAPAPANTPAPSTPYYFIGESSGYPAAAKPIQPSHDERNGSSRPVHDSREASASRTSADSRNGAIPAPGPVTAPAPEPRREAGSRSDATPAYYFTDLSRAPAAAQPSRDADVPQVPAGRGAFDVNAVRKDFPILRERVNGRPLVWFDNAATTQKPQSVIDRLAHFYAHENSNIHRAAHELAARATDAYESARNKVAKFLGASSAEEIIFVRGATEAINLVAFSWGKKNVHEGDEIIVSHLEHHANIVPWQMLASEKGAKLRVIPVDDSGQVRLDEYQKLLNDRTKIVAVTQVSNALGTVVPLKDIIELAHRAGARVLIDGAQAVSHLRVNVQSLDADFYVFSGHKIFGPTGIGVVYGKREVLEDMPPYQGGGNMIEDVTFEQTRYHGPPMRFEAGTGNIADAAGLGAALDYVDRVGLENIARYEHELLEYGMHCLRTIPGLRLIGTAKDKTSVMSFTLQGWKTEEVGKALNQEGVAVRAGHHCAQPILRRFGVETTVRPSVAFYNTFEEIDVMIAALRRLVAQRH